ncbi:hypothetical protein [Leptospira bouyouniensis]|uniref:Porin n=1 Tax=Leptospira bouyouniensis TaxID=2484911 RepID=A0ABY2L0N3_9LEPT|nr:hypothetical protein [Leptospira bouyouniensis]TGK45926.1 hypothetical protein EHQ10_18655 [Leptospira bouyouniensis]
MNLAKLKFIYIFITSIFFCVNSLYSNELDTKKNFEFSVRRHKGILNPFESELFEDTFRQNARRYDNSANFTELISRYNFSNPKYSIYGSFYELNKRSFSQNYFGTQSERFGKVLFYPNAIGDYFRMQANAGLGIRLVGYDLIVLNAGLMYLKSELASGSNFSNTQTFGQKFLGPELSIQLNSSTFYSFSVSLEYKIFYLLGRIQNEYAFASNNSPFGFIKVDSNPYSRYFGTEVTGKLNYHLIENISLSLGGRFMNAKVKPDDMRVNSGDTAYDFSQNIGFGFINGNSYRDKIESIFLEVNFRFN